MKFQLESERHKLLILLILVDLAFIAIHILHKYSGLLPGYLFNIEYDNGYAEVFQYVKEFWIILLLLYLSIKRSKFLYFSWALIFCFFILDDAFQAHEKLGGTIFKPWLVDFFGRNSRFGLKFKDYGELSVAVVAGTFFLALIGVSHYLSNDTTRKVSRHLFILVVLLSFFGVGIDMIHEHYWIHRSPTLVQNALGLVEDGGEMLIMSIILWYVFSLNSVKNEGIAEFTSLA